MKKTLFIILLAFSVLPNLTAAKKYVKIGGNDTADGSSWNTAYATLTKALSETSVGDRIWIARGTYYPAVADRDSSFELPAGVRVFGGFEVGGTSQNGRIEYGDGETNQTILSGDIGTLETTSDNSYRVINIPLLGGEVDTDSVGILNGLIIADGNGSGATNGVGIYSNTGTLRMIDCTIRNCISGANGGGLYVNEGKTYLDNVNVKNCSATNGGGAYFSNAGERFFINNSVIESNSASDNGGAVYAAASVFINSSQLTNNTASLSGGGLYIDGANINRVRTSLLANNSSSAGGGLFENNGSGSDINSSIIVNNNTSGDGAGLYFSQSTSGKLVNNTIANNNAASNFGGGVYVENTSGIIIMNNIITGNSLGQVDGSSVNTTIGYCYIDGGEGGVTGSTFNYQDGSFGATCVVGPLNFIDPTTSVGLNPTSPAYNEANWNMDPGSVCIDAGTPTSTTTPHPYFDASSGNNRVHSAGGYISTIPDFCPNGLKRINGTIDIGAFEVGGLVTTTFQTQSPTLISNAFTSNKVIYLNLVSDSEVKIFNLSGHLLLSQNFTKGGASTYNVSKAGIYFVTFKNTNGLQTVKLNVK